MENINEKYQWKILCISLKNEKLDQWREIIVCSLVMIKVISAVLIQVICLFSFHY